MMPVTRMRLPSRMPTDPDVRTSGRACAILESVEDDDGLEELARGDTSPAAMRKVARTLTRSARSAGAGAVTSGRWLANIVVDLAPRIPVRSRAVLVEQHHGLAGAALAE